jgi:hypothetical protein
MHSTVIICKVSPSCQLWVMHCCYSTSSYYRGSEQDRSCPSSCVVSRLKKNWRKRLLLGADPSHILGLLRSVPSILLTIGVGDVGSCLFLLCIAGREGSEEFLRGLSPVHKQDVLVVWLLHRPQAISSSMVTSSLLPGCLTTS